MAPASTLQDRIRQFESMNGDAVRPLQASKMTVRDRPRPSYPPVPRVQTSLGNSNGSNSSPDLMNDPVSPMASSYTVIKPTVPYVPRKPRIKSPSPSPPNLGCKTSLIDLRDSRVDERADWLKVTRPPLPPRMSSQNSGASASSSSKSWFSTTSVTGMQSRSLSNSLTVEHTYPPLNRDSNLRQRQGHVSASSMSSFHSVSLSSDGDTNADATSPNANGSSSNFIASYPIDKMNSASAPSEVDKDRDSLDDTFSFETVSSIDVGSPTSSLTHEWEKDFSIHRGKSEPPNLPSRPPPIALSSPNSTITSPYTSPPLSASQMASPPLNAVRRVPPPPPSRFTKPPPHPFSSRASVMSTATSASDRSSIFSAGTVTTAHTSIASCNQLFRPTPVPLVARKRYEAVFFANVNAQRRVVLKNKYLSPSAVVSPSNSNLTSPTTPRKGWRGISVDLVTNPEENPILSSSEDDVENSRLEGHVIRAIWLRSKLTPEKLKDTWNECALPGQSSLDKDAFAKGMWRIDEELRRVQSMRSSTMTMTSSNFRAKRTIAEPLLL